MADQIKKDQSHDFNPSISDHADNSDQKVSDQSSGDSDQATSDQSSIDSDSNPNPDPDANPDQSIADQSSIDPNKTSDQPTTSLSKRQLRKLKKKQNWEGVRQERRREERQRRQKRKHEAIARGETVKSRKRIKIDAQKESNCKVQVAIDMSFDDLMSEKDTKRALTQIQYCYSVNRRSANPMQLFVTSFGGKSRSLFDETRGCVNWDEKSIRLMKENYEEIFEKDKIVYLSAESTNVLDGLEDGKVYVIGGLVDHNAHKGMCHRLAEEKGINHARLPIDEYVIMKTRQVLTINQVFDIMLKWTESGDWEKAFFDVIPKRKEVGKKEQE